MAEQTSEQDAAVALSLANNLLQRFPNVDMLYGADDTYGIAAARAAQGAQKCGKVKVVFAVLGEAAEEMMRLGCADFVVAQQPVLIGRTAIQLADKLVKGVALDKKLVEISLVPVTKAKSRFDRQGLDAGAKRLDALTIAPTRRAPAGETKRLTPQEGKAWIATGSGCD